MKFDRTLKYMCCAATTQLVVVTYALTETAPVVLESDAGQTLKLSVLVV